MDAYHALNLDSTENMWKEARGVRDVLDHMLEYATADRSVDKLGELARDTRQNLERTFRERLDQQPHRSYSA
jgi:transcriptional regulator GlxA family with amidase domain